MSERFIQNRTVLSGDSEVQQIIFVVTIVRFDGVVLVVLKRIGGTRRDSEDGAAHSVDEDLLSRQSSEETNEVVGGTNETTLWPRPRMLDALVAQHGPNAGWSTQAGGILPTKLRTGKLEGGWR